LTIPQSLIEGKESKYQELLKQLTEQKITQKDLLNKLVIRSPFPVNESFAQMYSSIKESADMILELRTEEFACHKVVMTATSEYFKKALKENEYINKY
jgi:BTB/POZ domain